MPKHEVLNNVDHKDLRVITTRSAEFGDNVMYGLTFAAEFRYIQAHYPIVFRKDAGSGEFQAVALFGFEAQENLFLADDKWDATYIPLSVERLPFMIGVQQGVDGSPEGRQLMMHVDMDSPRLSQTQGEAVFLAHGAPTEYLERMNSVLKAIDDGLGSNPGFIAALLKADLLESFVLDVELQPGSPHRLMGFYTINEDKLAQLAPSTLADLNQQGYLLPIYMVIASMANLRALIARRQQRLALAG